MQSVTQSAMSKDITIYYLEITSRTQLRPSRTSDPKFKISECIVKQPQLNRFLYSLIGKDWNWLDKAADPDEKWLAYVSDPNLRTFLAYYEDSIAGYYELQKQSDSNVQICYLGLAHGFIGKGLGGALLTHAISSAFDWGASRVWVHTCTLDHKNALENYLARGMTLYKTETKKNTSPEGEKIQ